MGKVDNIIGIALFLGVPVSWILIISSIILCLQQSFGLVISVVFLILCLVIWLPLNLIALIGWIAGMIEVFKN